MAAIAQFSGLASGIDSASLIDAIIEAKQTTNKLREDDIDFLGSENDALEELNTKFLALADLLDGFRTANGGGVNKEAASSDTTVATASASAAAANSSYALTVSSVANTATGSFNHSYTSATDYVSTAGSGNVTVTVGTGSDQVVITAAVTANVTTLSDLVSAINGDPNNGGRVQVSAVNIGTDGSPDYRLVFGTSNSGTAKGSLSLAADGAITELATNTVEQATDAVFSISGISGSITRASNSISDVMSGLTFQLYKTGTANITVSTDAETSAASMDEIVTAFNDIVDYVNENDTIERVEEDSEVDNVYGTLAKTRVDNDFLASFREALFEATSTSGTAVTAMSELGFSTNRDGTITFDADDFKAAVAGDPLGASEVITDFADSTAGISGMIYEYTKLGGFIDIAQDSNNSEIENLQDAVDQLDRRCDSLRTSLEKTFANLESTVAELQSKQQELNSYLSGLSS